MAAAKKDAKKTPAADPMLRIHPVALELSKAGAALWLLDQLHSGKLSPLSRRPVGAERREPEMFYVNDLALEERERAGLAGNLLHRHDRGCAAGGRGRAREDGGAGRARWPSASRPRRLANDRPAAREGRA
jgi:hypothetical protein